MGLPVGFCYAELKFTDNSGMILPGIRVMEHVSRRDDKTELAGEQPQTLRYVDIDCSNVLADVGAVVGASAYELAVKNGFEGTEEEWLENLRYDHSEEFAAFVNQIVENTQTSQDAAQTSVNAANTAGNAANAANTSAERAAESESCASASEKAAAESERNAKASEAAVGQSAFNAADSAGAAATAKNEAEKAKNAAELAAGNASASEANAKASENAAAKASADAIAAKEKIQASADQIAKNKTDISELKGDLADITYTIYPTNIYDQTVALNGERLQSNGNTYKTSDYFTSGYIDVSFVGNVTLFFGTGNYALNSYAVAFYDASKNYIDGSYISTVANNVHMYNGAKYMRFSAQAQYYPAERNVHVSYGTQRASSYTPYFEPKKTIFTDEFYKNVSFTKDIIVCGYSKNDMNIPTFDLSQSQKVVVNVGQYVGILSPSTGFENVTIYNSTPTEFTLGQEEMLVFDKKEKVLKIIPIRSYAESVYYIPLLITGKNAILYGGQWLGCALWQMVGNNYKEQKLPFSPRKFKRAASNNAGDQSMCLCHEYYICVDAQDSDGFIKVVNKDDYSLVKVISHTLGHAGWSSYDEPSDSLLISNEDVSYIIEHFYENIGNTTSLNSTNCIVYNANIGTFIDGYNTIATVCGTADTLNNVTLVRYSIDRNGNFSEVSRYKGNYRLPVMQDIKYHNGCLYVSCGFKKVVIYKIQLFSSGDYEVVDAYNIAEDIYEQEGLIIDMDKMVLSVREATAITNKYFIETEFTN